mmetsp:Transcript_16151/g.54302  ORF Transcript_16151/g.54302 Transcript_16151/m.54302 type:complete len:205 (-) Transcript_16151:533-1147(-)
MRSAPARPAAPAPRAPRARAPLPRRRLRRRPRRLRPPLPPRPPRDGRRLARPLRAQLGGAAAPRPGGRGPGPGARTLPAAHGRPVLVRRLRPPPGPGPPAPRQLARGTPLHAATPGPRDGGVLHPAPGPAPDQRLSGLVGPCVGRPVRGPPGRTARARELGVGSVRGRERRGRLLQRGSRRLDAPLGRAAALPGGQRGLWPRLP